jgi:glucose/arabinose dehydrogenase
MRTRFVTCVAAFALVGSACTHVAQLPESATIGPNPQLPPPSQTGIPTVDVAAATGWPAGATPRAADGLRVNAFATGLDHPRWLYALPNGDVLVAETNRPPRDEPSGIKAWLMKKLMAKAGAGTPSANRITLLRDADGDGVAETRAVLVDGLFSPFGMAWANGMLYVANADGVVRFPFAPGTTRIQAKPERITDLPAGINHHWTKALLASRDGRKLYATVGSNSNVAEKGLQIEDGRAAIWEIDVATGTKRLFATGLRNPNGMVWEPTTGTLWTVVNERDELGSDLVPDYLTSVRDGAFYGWPYSYWGKHVDERVKPPRPDLVAKAVSPDYALGNHVAPLGLATSEGVQLGERFANGMFVGLHGSWNRKPKSGYTVVFVPFVNGRPQTPMVDVLTGFLNDKEEAQGRPVGVVIDARGALLVADDVGNTVWRVARAR